ncbi:PREDICTED: WAT1-related protein At3g30340-like [Populus euphratica]|uniref:WAT1-related protein n=1 Tax=Populus euphratica TaxID=75702 RepID=A0AAJ6XND2_POPEU|nr:PREDICTED: WAT1-related protein At3g30340-like [Populus euphratica]
MSDGGQWKPVVGMVVVNFAFAIVNVLFKKVLDQGTNSMVIATYRLSTSAIFLAPVSYYWERKSRPRLTASIFCHLFLGALFGLALTQYLFLKGLEYISATLACAFLNTVPVNTFILALLFGIEKASMTSKAGRTKVLGTLICMGGAVLLIFYKGIPLTNSHSKAATTDILNHADTMISGKKRQRWVVGSILSLAGCFMWSLWFLIQAKISESYPFQYSSTALISFLGAIQSAVLSLSTERNFSMWILRTKLEILSVLYAGIIGSGLCYVGMSWCVKQRGPVFTSAFTPFTQIFAAMFDFSILHEQLYLGSVLGSVLVILGLYTLLWGKSIEAGDCGEKQAHLAREEEHCDTEAQIPATISRSNP